MLNELDLLSQNIGRLIAISDRFNQHRHELEQQLQHMRTERDDARQAAEHLRGERDALRDERDILMAKIEDAQVRLNAILEKLPHQKASEAQAEMPAQHAEGDHA